MAYPIKLHKRQKCSIRTKSTKVDVYKIYNIPAAIDRAMERNPYMISWDYGEISDYIDENIYWEFDAGFNSDEPVFIKLQPLFTIMGFVKKINLLEATIFEKDYHKCIGHYSHTKSCPNIRIKAGYIEETIRNKCKN